MNSDNNPAGPGQQDALAAQRDVPRDTPGVPIDPPDFGRREFFFLTLTTLASGVVAATLSRPTEARTAFPSCTSALPNDCSTHGNTCTGLGGNSCSGAGANICTMWNVCEGGASANTCNYSGGSGNVCTGAGKNQCDGVSGANACGSLVGAANNCGTGTGGGSNVCWLSGAANSCVSGVGNSCGSNTIM